MFDSFYRARREDRTIPGTGLGLAIARGLTEAMGGRIEALSPSPCAIAARASWHDNNAMAQGRFMIADTGLQDRKLILLVDDEPQIHRFLRPTLEAAGYEVLRANTGADALRLAAQKLPSLTLLDLGLPDIDGQLVLSQLRRFNTAPVIVLSARDRTRREDSGA